MVVVVVVVVVVVDVVVVVVVADVSPEFSRAPLLWYAESVREKFRLLLLQRVMHGLWACRSVPHQAVQSTSTVATGLRHLKRQPKSLQERWSEIVMAAERWPPLGQCRERNPPLLTRTNYNSGPVGAPHNTSPAAGPE